MTSLIHVDRNSRKKDALSEYKICERDACRKRRERRRHRYGHEKEKMVGEMDETERNHLMSEGREKLTIGLSEHDGHEIHEGDMGDIAAASLPKLMNDFDEGVKGQRAFAAFCCIKLIASDASGLLTGTLKEIWRVILSIKNSRAYWASLTRDGDLIQC